MSYKNSRLIIISYAVSLIALIVIGILMRLQFVGFLPKELATLQWRQAHSHLGFFGVLVPMTWIINETFNNLFRYSKTLYFYLALVAISFFSFLDSGYNIISHIASGFIFSIWIFTFFRNESHQSKQIFEKIMNSVLLIFSLIMVILGRKIYPHLTLDKLAHGFVFNLLFLIIVPSVVKKILRSFQYKALWPVWWLGCLLMYLHETQIIVTHYGALILALVMISQLIIKFNELKKDFFYNVLIFITFGLLYLFIQSSELSYQFSIAMIHFIFLSFLTTYFLSIFLQYAHSIIFFSISSLMSTFIWSIDFFPEYAKYIHLSLAVLGTGLLILIVDAFYKFAKSHT